MANISRTIRWVALSVCIVVMGLGVYLVTRRYSVPVAHPQRGRPFLGMETFRRDTQGRYPEMMDISVTRWVAGLCYTGKYPILPPVTRTSLQIVPSRARFFIVGDMVSCVLDSRLTIILWHESLREHLDKMAYKVFCDGRGVECEVMAIDVLKVPVPVQGVLSRVMTTPPRYVAKVHLVCPPGLHEANEIRINVMRTDMVMGGFDYLVLRPRWVKEPFTMPTMPWAERPGQWDAMRREKYLRSQVDQMLACVEDPYSAGLVSHVLRHLFAADVDPVLRWKLLRWLEEIDKEKRLLSTIGRREIRRLLPKVATTQAGRSGSAAGERHGN